MEVSKETNELCTKFNGKTNDVSSLNKKLNSFDDQMLMENENNLITGTNDNKISLIGNSSLVNSLNPDGKRSTGAKHSIDAILGLASDISCRKMKSLSSSNNTEIDSNQSEPCESLDESGKYYLLDNCNRVSKSSLISIHEIDYN